jgi:peptidoglycan/xylan/chitin deacetylase (PgdA/CDA1 family)
MTTTPLRVFSQPLSFILSLAILLGFGCLHELSAQVKYIILKADDVRDFGGKNGPGTIGKNWTHYTDMIVAKNIKSMLGINGFVCDYPNGAAFWEKLAELQKTGRFQLFNHGYTHANYTAAGKDYTWQLDDLTKNQTLVKDKLGITMNSIGMPENKFNADTIAIINSMNDITCWIYGDATKTTKAVLARDGNIENPTFNPDFAVFQAKYQSYLDKAQASGRDYLCLQMHPNNHSPVRQENLGQILDFLIAQGMKFVTLDEYYTLHPSTQGSPTK